MTLLISLVIIAKGTLSAANSSDVHCQTLK